VRYLLPNLLYFLCRVSLFIYIYIFFFSFSVFFFSRSLPFFYISNRIPLPFHGSITHPRHTVPPLDPSICPLTDWMDPLSLAAIMYCIVTLTEHSTWLKYRVCPQRAVSFIIISIELLLSNACILLFNKLQFYLAVCVVKSDGRAFYRLKVRYESIDCYWWIYVFKITALWVVTASSLSEIC